MSADRLYDLLSDQESHKIPWNKATEHFLQLKLASGGLLSAEVDAIKLAAPFGTKLVRNIARKEIRSPFIEPVKEVAPWTPHEKRASGMRLLDLVRASGAKRPDPEDLETVLDAAYSGAVTGKERGAISDALMTTGALAGKAIGNRFRSPIIGGLAGGLAGRAGGESLAKKAMSNAIRKYAAKRKMADAIDNAPYDTKDLSGVSSRNIPEIPETEPVADVPEDLQPNPMDQVMELLQKANETEFFQQKAIEAEQTSDSATERANMLEDQLNQLMSQVDADQQENAQRNQMNEQATQATQEQSQMSAEEAMASKNEAMDAQHQNIAIRQAVTSYRQSLMDLLSQDPTQVAPPTAPSGPMSGPPIAAPPSAEQGYPGVAPEGQAPPPEGMEGPPPEVQMPPPGAEGMQGPPPEMVGPPPAPEAPKAPGGQPISINIGGAKKPSAPKPPTPPQG